MATIHLPRSLVAILPGSPPRLVEVPGATLAEVLRGLDDAWPGVWDRVCEPGPRIRRHMNVFVDGVPADLACSVGPRSVVHVIPAVSGG